MVHLVKGQESAPIEDEAAEASEREKMAERLEAFVASLESEARTRVERRLPVEQRWLMDLRQYHGQYEPDVLERLRKAEGSQVFQNLTRPKTNAMMARLWDLLFPTDDRNWGIKPTPVPELTDSAEAALEIADDAEDTAAAFKAKVEEARAAGDEETARAIEQEAAAAEAARNEAEQMANRSHEILNEAKRRADLMQDEIADQLATCSYQAECRDMIEDACKTGTGILKGPVLGQKIKQKWDRAETQDEHGNPVAVHVLTHIADNRPAAYRVDPWGFFPDPDARRPEDSEGFFERHLMSRSKLRKLSKRPDIDDDVLRELLTEGPQAGSAPAYLVDLHSLTGEDSGDAKDKFQVWEYTGPIEQEDFALLADTFDDEDAKADIEDMDPLIELHAKIWFCQGRVLSFALHPLDSNEPIYSVFNLERDEYGPWGFGIPYLMRDPQSILNGALRMMMDNAGLGTGPQIVINNDVVSPSDGSWAITPRKVWLRNNADAQPNMPAFETYNIPIHQQDLGRIMMTAAQAADEVTAMPQIAQGEQGTGVTKTAQGMAILMNSANVVFRRVVKNFDDDVTVPMIRRFYHWNMQFHEDERIKGDYDIDARGSSVLLVREMQAQNLLMIAQMFGDHPIYGPMLKHENLLRQIFKAHMIATDEVTKTDREFKQFIKEQSQQGDPMAQMAAAELELKKAELELRREEMANKVELSNMEWDKRERIAYLTFDAKMNAVAESLNMKRDELDAKMRMHSESVRTGERRLAAEISEKRRTGVSAGGSI
jgi:hypothetical protein